MRRAGALLPKSHTRKANTAVTFPKELYGQIVEFISNDKRHGYVSVSEFLKDAGRRRLEELQLKDRAAEVGRRLDDTKVEVDHASAKLRAGAPNVKGKFCSACGSELHGTYCSSCGTKSG